MSGLRSRGEPRPADRGGYRELLTVAVPLILSTGAVTVQHFVDRIFLTWWHPPEALAAALPAGILCFTFLSLFIGTAGYVSTFAAQYHGAGRPERIGPAVWQGFYVSLLGGAVLLAVRPLAETMFRLAGHEGLVLRYEVAYFRTLCLGATPAILSSAFAGFFSGLGRTWPVMWVNVGATAVNLVLDYGLIFGRLGMPELGMEGAALGTVASSVFACAAYLVLLARPANDGPYRTLRGWRLDGVLLRRLLRFGLPSGAHFFLDVAGFSIFLLLVGRLGETALAATNLAFSVNSLAFMPMFGIGVAVSVLVGQHLGRERPDLAAASTWRGFVLTLGYMAVFAAGYVLLPDLFLAPFAAGVEPERFEETRALAVVLLRFVALYSLFDAMNIVFGSAVKGAGDTRFVMVLNAVLSGILLVAPTYVAVAHLGAGVQAVWVICSAYICVLGISFLLRFLAGRWKTMRVIEDVPVPPVTEVIPEAPTADLGL